MKKLLLALGALATLAMVAPSCEKPGPNQEPKKEEVKELSVNPTSFELYKGDKIKFALAGADVNVTLVPNSVSYSLESSDANIAKVEGKTVTAMNEGNATITVKAGNKTATVALTVKGKPAIDESKFRQDIYVVGVGEPATMKASKSEITTALATKDFENKTFYSDDQQEKVAYQYLKKEGTQNAVVQGLAYHFGDGMIRTIGIYNPDSWSQGIAKLLLEHYGFKENFEEGETQGGNKAAVAFDKAAGLSMTAVLLETRQDKSELISLFIRKESPNAQSSKFIELPTSTNFERVNFNPLSF